MKLEIKKIRQYQEDEINKKIEEIDDPNLTYEQKRLKVLDEMNTSKSYPAFIDFPDNKIQLIDITKIRRFVENIVQEKIKDIKDSKLTTKEKRLQILAEMNTSISYSSIEEDEEYKKIIQKKNENKENSIFRNDDSLNSTGGSTMTSDMDDIPVDIKNYRIAYKLYDIKQNIYLDNLPLKKIDEEKFVYLYKNKLITYYFIKSIQFGKEYNINNDIITDDKYEESYGLFFCGKQIELDNEENKKCCPHDMMCIYCMNKNKKRYILQSKYAININGRAAKKYNELFHCFGLFLVGNQYENCVGKFSCEACKLLDKYKKYYFPEN